MQNDTSKIIIAGILLIGAGGFLIAYGIKGGLFDKKILANYWSKSYATGPEAVRRGWFYISLGAIIIAVYLLALIKTFKA